MSQPDLEFRTAWQRQDLNLQETAIDFWSSLGILPTQVNAQDRAQELCVVAYADDLVAGCRQPWSPSFHNCGTDSLSCAAQLRRVGAGSHRHSVDAAVCPCPQ